MNLSSLNIALGTWSWGEGAVGGDEVFGSHLGEAEQAAAASGVDIRGAWEHPMA